MIHWSLGMLPERAFRVLGKKLQTLEGGGSAPPPPDYSSLAASNTAAAADLLQLGKEQLAQNQAQYDTTQKTLAPLIAQETAAQAQQTSDAAKTFSETNPSLAANAGLAQNYSTAGMQNYLAGQAGADMSNAQAAQDAAAARNEAAMGVNPNSGKAQALSGLERVTNAAQTAGAITNARNQSVQTGFNMNASVAGQSGLTNAFYGGANSSGGAAGGQILGLGNQGLTGANMGYGTMSRGNEMIINGNNGLAGIQQQGYDAALQANASSSAGLGSAIGSGIGAYAAYAALA